MDKKILITLAIFTLSILLVQSFYTVPMAYAQQFLVVENFAYPIKATHYQTETDSFWILSASSTKTILYQVDRSTRTIIGTFNHTSSFNGAGRVAVDLWCGKTDCFITSGSGGIASQLIKISTEDISPNIFAGQNVTGTYTYSVSTTSTTGFGHLTGRDQVNGGFGTITIWIDACVDAGCNSRRPIIVDGISMTLAGNLPSEYSGTQVTIHDLQWSGIEGTTDNHLAVVTGGLSAGSQSELIIYSLATLATNCQVSIPNVDLGIDLAVNYEEADSVNNKIYVSADQGVVYIFNDSCVLQDTITSGETGLTSDIRFIEYDSGRVFMQESGANAFISQMLVNSTGHIIDTDNTIYSPLPNVAQNVFDSIFTTLTLDNMVLLSGNGVLWFPYTGSQQEIGILIFSGTGGGGSPVNPLEEFCAEVANQGLLKCVLFNNGSSGGLTGTSTLLNQSATNIVCQVGILSCTQDDDGNFTPENPDIKTNGVGYLYTVIAFGIMIGIFWVASRGDLVNIPTFVWFIGTIGLLGALTAMNVIDPTFLIIGVVTIVAFAVAKAKGIFSGGQIFAGETN